MWGKFGSKEDVGLIERYIIMNLSDEFWEKAMILGTRDP